METRPRSLISGNICFKFSAQCICSAFLNPLFSGFTIPLKPFGNCCRHLYGDSIIFYIVRWESTTFALNKEMILTWVSGGLRRIWWHTRRWTSPRKLPPPPRKSTLPLQKKKINHYNDYFFFKKVNQPSITASATSKKYSSSARRLIIIMIILRRWTSPQKLPPPPRKSTLPLQED
jgi:hypothetical protein